MQQARRKAKLIKLKQRKQKSAISFAEYRAQIKLPYKPSHMTEEQIKKVVELMVA